MRVALLVLGMHRSGTSALCRSLNLMGAALPERLIEAKPDNESGFWEPSEIVALHDDLLRSAGSRWDDLAEFPRGWYESPVAETYVDRMADLVRSNYGESPLFVLKDPRICRLVPFWDRVLGRLGIRACHVIPVRNPLEVANSLRKRNGFSVGRSVLIWLRHVLDAERDTRGGSRSLVNYESLLAEPQRELSRIAADLGVSWPRDGHRVRLELEEFLNDRLRHNRSSREDLARDGRIAGWIERAFDALQRGIEGQEERMRGELDGLRAEFDAGERVFGPLLAEADACTERLLKHVRGLEEARAEQEARVTNLEAAKREQEARAEGLESALAERKGREEELKGALVEVGGRVVELEAVVKEQEARVSELKGVVAEERARTAGLQTALAEREARAAELEGALAEVQARAESLEVYRRELAEVKSSRAWGLAQRFSRVRRRLVPVSSKRHHAMLLGAQAIRVLKSEGVVGVGRKATRRLCGYVPEAPTVVAPPLPPPAGPVPIPARAEGDYAAWIARHEPDEAGLAEQKAEAERMRHRPRISLLTPVLDTPGAILDATIWSVANQTYDRWELCLVDGGSTDPGTRQSLEGWAARDSRVRVVRLESNRGISGNTNVALGMARGEYVALLDHDDMLPPFALYEVAKRINEEPEVDFLYSDKDLINGDGSERFWPLFKPCWSPEVMLNANYLTHLTVMRTSLVREVGGWRPETDGAQDWDVFLRVLEQTDRVAHIPKVLYHWRLWGRSVASGLAAKPYVVEAQQTVLNDHLRRLGHDGELYPDPWTLERNPAAYSYRFRPVLAGVDLVSVVVVVGSGSARVVSLIEEVLGPATAYEPLELVLVHCGAKTPQLAGYYAELSADRRVRLVESDSDPDSFEARRAGARVATGQRLLFLSAGLRPLSPDWLSEMVQVSRLPGVGAVGARLLTADDRVEHAGLVVGLDGLVGAIFAGLPADHADHAGDVGWYRNYTAVSGDCLLISRSLYEELGGLDVGYQRYGADVALCLGVCESGRRVAYTPFARLRRVGPAPSLAGVPREDLLRLYERCLPMLAAGDRYYNPNLATISTAPRLRIDGLVESPREKLSRALKHWEQAKAAASVPACVPSASFHEGRYFASNYNFASAHLAASQAVHAAHPGPLEIRSINWFIPSFHNAYYGGIYTILRFASYLRRHKGVESRFYVVGGGDPIGIHDAISGAFPHLRGSTVQVVADDGPDQMGTVAYADACVATLWSTAYFVLKFNRTRRKFYFVQDAEPLFYPAGSTSALTEATYRFGFHGITNTVSLREIYEREHGGTAIHFTPCVDTELFRPEPRGAGSKGAYRVFYYGRPNNPRNGFELGCVALQRLKQRMGHRVEILAAGDRWDPSDYGLRGVVENLGLLRFDQTAELYRTCDAGLVMMFTRHPSYLPFEFMASGCLVVTNRNAATTWLLRDGENCLLTEPSADCIAETLERGLADEGLRGRITSNALELIAREHSDWSGQIERVFAYMTDPCRHREEWRMQPVGLPGDRMRAAG